MLRRSPLTKDQNGVWVGTALGIRQSNDKRALMFECLIEMVWQAVDTCNCLRLDDHDGVASHDITSNSLSNPQDLCLMRFQIRNAGVKGDF